MISQIEIGKRIAELRKQKVYSQDELAGMLNIPRPSLAQIELGKRKISAEELFQLSKILQFSMDKLLSDKSFTIEDEKLDEPKEKNKRPEERISIPKLQVEKFKQLLLYILEKCAGRPNVGETVLYKLLYFSEFNYYEMYEEHLVGATFKKLPYGPVPQRLDSILNDMQEKGMLKMVKTNYHNYTQKRYLPLEKANLTQLKASEKDVIDKVIDQMGDWSAAMISDYSHKDKPWKATEDNDIIDYELVFYRTPPYSVRVYDENEI